jgi:hypothetical protein
MADRIERQEAPPEATYANYFVVGHNTVEFLMDFGQHYSDSKEPRLRTRIITGPVYAKAFLALLRDSVEQYERAFGTIPDAGEGETGE